MRYATTQTIVQTVVSLSILLYSGLSSKYFVRNVTEKEGYQIQGRIRNGLG